jgi:hypothetical protein
VTDASSSQHRQAWDLIPWIVNGTASESEQRGVEEHLHSCADCREELEFQRRLQCAMARESAPEADATAGWARLRQRLDADRIPTALADLTPRRLRRVERMWLPWVVAVMLLQGVGLGVLGTALWSRSSPSPVTAMATTPISAYRTLSAPQLPAAPATVRAVFAPTMTLAELHAALAGAHLQIVSGPSDADVWSLGPARDSTRAATEAALRMLRASSNVRFAEPIGTAP